MASRRGLTGGTGDVNPQFLSFNITQGANDQTVVLPMNLPIQRLATTGRAQVMEVLKVKYDASTVGGSGSAELSHRYVALWDPTMVLQPTFTFRSLKLALLTSDPGTAVVAGYSNPRCFSFYNKVRYSAFTAGGTYGIFEQEPFTDDLTDGAGHGFLVATDTIYAQLSTQNTGAINGVEAKIYYRWKNVGLQEYIGIVQSQQ